MTVNIIQLFHLMRATFKWQICVELQHDASIPIIKHLNIAISGNVAV